MIPRIVTTASNSISENAGCFCLRTFISRNRASRFLNVVPARRGHFAILELYFANCAMLPRQMGGDGWANCRLECGSAGCASGFIEAVYYSAHSFCVRLGASYLSLGARLARTNSPLDLNPWPVNLPEYS